ncbi:MAG: YihY family inner membrane protein [Verrucomicrobiae bacterium]|nr:YihY family inner membrane protein [Verrucomicrobiae bacterium]
MAIANGKASRLTQLKDEALGLWEDRGLDWRETPTRHTWKDFAHFWILVFKSFVRNRCPLRAAALAYTTLLAIIPVLAVAASIAIAFLQKDAERTIRDLIDRGVAYVAPSLDLEVKTEELQMSGGREMVAAKIADYVNNVSSGALGVTSTIALIFVAIQMLRSIELTFNDIWGVSRGRPLLISIIQYWAVITLGPLLILVAMGFSSTPHFAKTLHIFNQYPALSVLLFSAMPFFLLSAGFTAFYMFMPNTRVRFSAALMGGAVAGFLWQLNSLMSALYTARVVTYSKIYGSLGLVPLLLASIYLAWLFLLFGAQVAYAYQNRSAYLQERVTENLHQKSREFAALRIMTRLAIAFVRGEPPPTAMFLSHVLGIPTRLVTQILTIMTQAHLAVEVAGRETGYSPARPLDKITVADILQAMRTAHGQDLETTDDPARTILRQEFQQVQAAEAAAGQTTLAALAEKLTGPLQEKAPAAGS